MSTELFSAYLNERYTPADFKLPLDKIAEILEPLQRQKGILFLKTDKGFINYQLQGDALIIHDIFVVKEHRATKEARRMFNAIEQLATLKGKRVLIALKDNVGQNQHLGVTAIKAGGFQLAHKLPSREIYIKGI